MSFLQDLGSFLGEAQSLRNDIVRELTAETNEVKQTVTDTAQEIKGAAAEIQDTIVESTSLPDDLSSTSFDNKK